ncbi:MAG: hypothetical protein M3O91_04385, partial [Chloroflexota bacterium]|nr:hypothetical protein [Chloroflexota bacterium]
MTQDRARAFVPIQSLPLPRPLRRFGPAFPSAVAEHYAALHVPWGGAVVDPLPYPYSAADAVERSGGRGLGAPEDALATWARRTIRAAPGEEETLAALERVGDSVRTGGVPHRAAMRELYTSHCRSCHAPVVIEAFMSERAVPARARRAFRCGVCARDGRSLLIEIAGAEDEERARAIDPRGPAFRDLVDRFGDDRRLGESVAVLYTPRNLEALMATVDAVESVAEGPAGALLGLALVEVIVCGSSDGAPPLIERGRARRRHGGGPRREVNIWLEYERTVRELAAWLQADALPRGRGRDHAVGTAGGTGADLVLFAAPIQDLLGGWADVASAICLGAHAPREHDRVTAGPCATTRASTENGPSVRA